MRFTFSLFILLIIFWSINSEYNTGLLLILEFVSISLVLLIAHGMKLMDHESQPLHLITRIGPFYLWLAKEVALGSLYVLKKIFLGTRSLSPKIIRVNFDFKDEVCKVIFANSITLIPGTLSLEVDHGSVSVHTLTHELADELMKGELARHIKRLEN